MKKWLLLVVLVLVALAVEGKRMKKPKEDHKHKDDRSDSRQVESAEDPSVEERSSKPYRVVCYYTNWAWYRKGVGKYVPEDIDPRLCTHIIYAFATLDPNTLQIKVFDTWADIDNKMYEKVASLSKKGVTTAIGIGGWNDSEGDKYSRLVNSATARTRFVQHVVSFIEKFGFLGLDFDWEYPKCWQNSCSRGPASDKRGFAKLMEELSAAFSHRNWTLTAAVSANSKVIDDAYDVPSLSKSLDWINLMTYDFYGSWDKVTRHHSPLDQHGSKTFNTKYAVDYWLREGMPKKKVVVGMPMYGRSFTLADPHNHGLEAPATGPGKAGPITNSAGMLAFYEICTAVKRDHWETHRVGDDTSGHYAYSHNQWVGYDDVSDITMKSKYIINLGLGSGMIWALDLDDFQDTCKCGRYPLLTALSSTLNGGPAPSVQNCASSPKEVAYLD